MFAFLAALLYRAMQQSQKRSRSLNLILPAFGGLHRLPHGAIATAGTLWIGIIVPRNL